MNRWLPARVLARSCFLMLAIALGVGARGHALNYELSFNKPNTHLMKITIHAGDLDGKSVAFAMVSGEKTGIFCPEKNARWSERPST